MSSREIYSRRINHNPMKDSCLLNLLTCLDNGGEAQLKIEGTCVGFKVCHLIWDEI